MGIPDRPSASALENDHEREKHGTGRLLPLPAALPACCPALHTATALTEDAGGMVGAAKIADLGQASLTGGACVHRQAFCLLSEGLETETQRLFMGFASSYPGSISA